MSSPIVPIDNHIFMAHGAQMKLADYLRQEALTQVEFARLSGISKFLINRYVRGTGRPRHDNMSKIARATQGAVATIYDYKSQ